MAKIHFFKLAQELGKNPASLLKELKEEGIVVRSASSTVDEEQEATIRKFVTEKPKVAQAPVSAPAPVIKEEKIAEKPVEVQREAKAENTTSVRPQERKGNLSQKEGVIKLPKVEGSKPVVKSAKTPQKVKSPLLSNITDSNLSPEADFGIVSTAATANLNLTRPPRPARPPQGGGGNRTAPRPGGPGREGGVNFRNQQGGNNSGGFTSRTPRPNSDKQGADTGIVSAAPPDIPAKGGTQKKEKKTIRTVFTDNDRSPRAGLNKRPNTFTSTVIRGPRKPKRVPTGGNQPQEAFVVEEPIIVTGAMSIAEISEKVRVTPTSVITKLITKGIMATVNQQLQPEQVVDVFSDLGFEALYEESLVEHADWRLSASTTGGEVEGDIRPPVVTILGHVDHGKTSLLDSIRETNVTAGEHGGITQHIGAYQIEAKGKKITFLDTPGHAAFTAMRARGANLTDIAVLVVAADDGIQPQTVEAIDHAKAAKVPIIVAINKIDVPDANPSEVKQQLTHHELIPEEWGGETIVVELSAKTRQNIDTLLDMILLVAEVQELRAVRDGKAKGAVVESKLDKQRGSVSTMLVQQGTIKVGDALVVGMVAGKIRAMFDDKGKAIKKAGPSRPIEITGLPEVPIAGDLFRSEEHTSELQY